MSGDRFSQQLPPRANRRVGVGVAWVAIVGVLVFVIIRTWLNAHTPAAEQAGDDISLQMASRNAVGYRILLQTSGAEEKGRDKIRQVSGQIGAQAHTPTQRLQNVTVIGELNGAAAAIDELDRSRSMLNTPDLKADSQSLRTLYTESPAALSLQSRSQLVADLGWHGQLALSFGQPSTDQPRQKIVSSSVRALVASIGFELLIGVLLLAGIGLFTLAIVRLVDGRVQFVYEKSRLDSGPFIEAFALYLVGYVGIGVLFHYAHIRSTWSAYVLDTAWVIFAACWPLLRGVKWNDLRRGLGWQAGRGFFREALAGIGAYVATMPLLAVAISITALLSSISGEKPIHPIVFGAGGASARAIVGLYVLASIWAPIVEETMFRGALFHHLRASHRWLFSALLSGVIFASLHPQGWTAIPLLAAIGITFAAIREWRGTTIASAVAHALNNAVATTVMILVLG
ncbi:MAG TPA: type II CAAX endopeptidase family protein [Tepidisphaeraceae bacterium]|jgi:membrane protease YdiL (CAAX protease family)